MANPAYATHQVKRIPLYGLENYRSFWDPAATTSSGVVGIGVVGVMVVGVSSTGKFDQKWQNCILEMLDTPETGGRHFFVYKRPGFAVHTTPAVNNIGQSIMVWTGQGSGDKVISAFGNTNSTLYDGTTSKGASGGLIRKLTERVVGTTPTVVAIAADGDLWYYQDGGSFTEVTDTDYPSKQGSPKTVVGNPVHLDGYTFVLTKDGYIYNSDRDSITAWSALSYLRTDMNPDTGVGLIRWKDYIIAFGTNSMEFFKNVGHDVGSPLQRVAEQAVNIGLYGSESIVEFMGDIFFVSSTNTGSPIIYKLGTEGLKKISNTYAETVVSQTGATTLFLNALTLFGHNFVMLYLSGLTLVYDVDLDKWVEWTPNAATGVLWTNLAANTSATNLIYAVSVSSTSGSVYKINPVTPVYTDVGTNYTMVIQTSLIDFDTHNRKFLSRLTLVGSQNTSANAVSISWTDDDYTTFSTVRDVDLTNNIAALTGLGSFRRRGFKLSNTTALPVRVEALEFEYTTGNH